MPTTDYNFEDRARIPVRPLSFENKDLALAKEIMVNYESGTIYIKKEDGEIIIAATSKETMVAISNYIAEHPEIVTEIPVTGADGQIITIQQNFNEIYENYSELSDTVTKNKQATDKAIEDTKVSLNKKIDDTKKAIEDTAKDTYSPLGHGHNYAGSDSDGGAANSANKVNKKLTLKAYINDTDTNPTEIEFDGSAAKTINIAAKVHDHDDTYYKKTGGEINGDVSITQNLAVNGNTLTRGDTTTTGKNKAGSQEVTGDSTLKGLIILTSKCYGTELPSNGVEGQLFFKIIDE